MKYLAAAMCLLLVAACDTTKRHVVDASQFPTTKYHVESIEIHPGNDKVKNDPDYPLVESLVMEKLKAETAKMPDSGQPVDLYVSIHKLALYIEPALVILYGDHYSMEGHVMIRDPQTSEIIDSAPVAGIGSGRGGPLGLVGDAMYEEQEKIDSTVSSFAQWALHVPYPEMRDLLKESANPRSKRR